MNIDPTEQIILKLGQQAFEAVVLQAQVKALERALKESAAPSQPSSPIPANSENVV